MNELTIGVMVVAAGLLLMSIGMPIGPALGLVSFIGIAWILDIKAALGTIAAVPYTLVGDWNLTSVPMFLLMGYVAFNAGLSAKLFRACRLLLSWLPGGLAVASVGACALFSSASGSSMATASAMARIASPEMLRYGYDRSLASAVIASAGTLGSLIPPSILLILYGFFAGASVGQLFLAGVIPGLLTALLYSAMIIVRASLNPSLAPAADLRAKRRDILDAVATIWPLPVIICGILLGISIGIFTPTEAGAAGAALTILLAWMTGGLTRSKLWNAVYDTLIGTASIFIIVIATVLLARLLALSTIPTVLTQFLVAKTNSPLEITVVVAVVYVILGMFVESIGLLLLTLPIVLPLVNAAHMDLIWFGIIVIKLLEIGMVTPPVGLNVYVISAALGDLVSLKEVFRGVLWFIVMDLIALVLFVAFPEIVLWLPRVSS